MGGHTWGTPPPQPGRHTTRVDGLRLRQEAQAGPRATNGVTDGEGRQGRPRVTASVSRARLRIVRDTRTAAQKRPSTCHTPQTHLHHAPRASPPCSTRLKYVHFGRHHPYWSPSPHFRPQPPHSRSNSLARARYARPREHIDHTLLSRCCLVRYLLLFERINGRMDA